MPTGQKRIAVTLQNTVFCHKIVNESFTSFIEVKWIEKIK